MKMFYGGVFMNKDMLEEEGIFYPIKLEYYKTEQIYEKNIEMYGVEVIKTEYIKDDIKIEKANIEGISNDEDKTNKILDILKKHQVTPVSVKEVIEDLTKY